MLEPINRFSKLRAVSISFSMAVLYGIPLSGVARVDLWAGHHRAAMEDVDVFYGAGAIAVSIAAFYFVTFLANGVGGRLFCGFGCPVGQLSRCADVAEASRRRPRDAAFALLLAGAGFLWFADPAVLIEGSLAARAIAIGAWLGFAGVLLLFARRVRWRFCEAWCPIGLYYSVVKLPHGLRVWFDAEGACHGCDLCTGVCPVGLHPRELLSRKKDGLGGIGIDGFAESNHCLSCGDCVRACEHAFRKRPDQAPLTLGFRKRK